LNKTSLSFNDWSHCDLQAIYCFYIYQYMFNQTFSIYYFLDSLAFAFHFFKVFSFHLVAWLTDSTCSEESKLDYNWIEKEHYSRGNRSKEARVTNKKWKLSKFVWIPARKSSTVWWQKTEKRVGRHPTSEGLGAAWLVCEVGNDGAGMETEICEHGISALWPC
jgi:hypothetical protein